AGPTLPLVLRLARLQSELLDLLDEARGVELDDALAFRHLGAVLDHPTDLEGLPPGRDERGLPHGGQLAREQEDVLDRPADDDSFVAAGAGAGGPPAGGPAGPPAPQHQGRVAEGTSHALSTTRGAV